MNKIFYLFFIIFMYLVILHIHLSGFFVCLFIVPTCESMSIHMSWEDQKINYRSWFSTSIVCVLRNVLRSANLAARQVSLSAYIFYWAPKINKYTDINFLVDWRVLCEQKWLTFRMDSYWYFNYTKATMIEHTYQQEYILQSLQCQV